jgi:hypothetical protein
MHSLVYLTGSYSMDNLKKVVSQVEVLANQPQLKVDEIFVDKNPQLCYREIFVSWIDPNDGIKYHVMDMGRVEDAHGTIPIGSKIYSEEEVKKISR